MIYSKSKGGIELFNDYSATYKQYGSINAAIKAAHAMIPSFYWHSMRVMVDGVEVYHTIPDCNRKR